MDKEISDLCKALIRCTREKSLTIATAESCTAGGLAKHLGETPGAGGVFLGGFVCYDKAFKSDVLKVPREIIDRSTAVSEIVAAAMASGALELSGANMAASITGVAGPEPDEDGNPVGLAFIAARGSRGQMLSQKLLIKDQDPDAVRKATIAVALKLLAHIGEHWDGDLPNFHSLSH